MTRQIPPPPAPPPLRLDLPLPAWRYVPGQGPHPLREGGHGGCGLPEDAPVHEAMLRGLDLLAHRFPWEAHEAFEHAWRQLPHGSGARQATAGLVKLCAALLRSWCGDPAAARRLVERATADLDAGAPPSIGDARPLLEQVRAFVEGGAWPEGLPVVSVDEVRRAP